MITATVPREGLFRAQTPQAFRFATLLAAHQTGSGAPATDDASLLEAVGQPVAIVPGSEDNIKLTYAEDLTRLERAMTAQLMPRVGTGFDVHVLAAGRRLVLCGVAVPHDKGPGRPFGRRCRHPCAVRRDLWRAGGGRYRPALPTQRSNLEGCRQRPLPCPCRRTHRRAARVAGQRRRHADLRAPEDRAACRGDGRTPGGNPRRSMRRASRSRRRPRKSLASPAAEEGIAAQAVATILLPG